MILLALLTIKWKSSNIIACLPRRAYPVVGETSFKGDRAAWMAGHHAASSIFCAERKGGLWRVFVFYNKGENRDPFIFTFKGKTYLVWSNVKVKDGKLYGARRIMLAKWRGKARVLMEEKVDLQYPRVFVNGEDLYLLLIKGTGIFGPVLFKTRDLKKFEFVEAIPVRSPWVYEPYLLMTERRWVFMWREGRRIWQREKEGALWSGPSPSFPFYGNQEGLSVAKAGKYWFAFFNDSRKVYWSYSRDLLTWSSVKPVPVPPTSSWVKSPAVCCKDGEICLLCVSLEKNYWKVYILSGEVKK